MKNLVCDNVDELIEISKKFSDTMKTLNEDFNDELKTVDYRYIVRPVTFENPLTFGFQNAMLTEGLIHTYPIEKTVSYIKDYFGLIDNQIEVKECNNGGKAILILIQNYENNVEIVEKAMNYCGYFLSAKNIPKFNFLVEKNFIYLQFEPKFQDDISLVLRNEETMLRHLTPYYNVDKIKNIGFSPRCKNEMFNYPGRIYFFRGSTEIKSIISLGKQLFLSNKSLGNNGDYALFTLDLNKIDENVSFYIDPNYSKGIFTSDNISPNSIIEIQKIKFRSKE